MPGEMMSKRRNELDWSLASVGEAVAKKVGRPRPFSTEAVRKWEKGTVPEERAVRHALDDLYGFDGALVKAFGITQPDAGPGFVELDQKLTELLALVRGMGAALRKLADDDRDPPLVEPPPAAPTTTRSPRGQRAPRPSADPTGPAPRR